ncbi:MAG: hypothetical protein J0J06_03135 [Sphingomonas sp.]|uniref:hypothetical protein n=1 Tax=Sphingomonas sp. TaxID=28214 RepID=UPI001AD4BC04|nr:hypothetical protein [Sphingomonas sp.]MBN8814425.1 hypothetical protein [Sphingomonas sp.]
MSFKEKIAWISVVTTILVWGGYFGFMAATGGRMPGPVYLVGFFGAVIVQTILVVIASIVTAVLAPKDASAGSDERDRDISRRAYAIAYPVLLTLIVLVAASMHFGITSRDMAYEIMAAIVIAEIVHYGAQIAGYRNGRHG